MTCCDDGVVARWRKQKVDWKLKLGSKPCSADFHPDGSFVVVGSVDGHLISVNGETGLNRKTVFVGDSAITSVRFNPIGELLAVAAGTGIMFIYHISKSGKSFRKSARITCFTTQILNCIDWSHDGRFIQLKSQYSSGKQQRITV